MTTTGIQIDGQALYEQQKSRRTNRKYPSAPTIVATNLQVPDNIGSVLRLADAAGSNGVIFTGATDIDFKRVHKTARNCEALVEWDVCTIEQFVNKINTLQPLIAIEITTKSTNIFETILPDVCTFVIGNERYGIPEILLSKCSQAIHIPMYGTNGSMNVTHALSIALFEWRRQKSHF